MARSPPRRSPPWGLAELPSAAERRLRPDVWEYVQSGAGEEWTLRSNATAFDRWALVPRVLNDIRSVDLRTELLGTAVAAPFFAAPTAYHAAVHREGERATSRALARAGVLGVFSTLSSRSIEEIAKAAPEAPRWFQLYLQSRPDVTAELVRRAERSGYLALVVTVDAPVLGSRDVQARRGFALDRPAPIGNGRSVKSPARGLSRQNDRFVVEDVAEYSWQSLDRLRETTDLPLVVKGVLSAEDARRAVEHGARAVIVSNHGGRQLDRSVPALDALPEVVEAVGRRAEVYVDGGVRRGPEVLIALALGARAAGLGRTFLWALAAGGELGVRRAIDLLSAELANGMTLLGRRSVDEVDRGAVRDRTAPGAPPAVGGGP